MQLHPNDAPDEPSYQYYNLFVTAEQYHRYCVCLHSKISGGGIVALSPPLSRPSPFSARLPKPVLRLLKRRSQLARFLSQGSRLTHCVFLNSLQLFPKRHFRIHHVRASAGMKSARNPH